MLGPCHAELAGMSTMSDSDRDRGTPLEDIQDLKNQVISLL